MKVYENIVIGNFLFELGVRMGKSAPALPVIGVNMLQQCPWDQKIGDVLLSNASLCRIIEFKRKQNRSKKELEKRDRIASGIAKTKRPEYFETLSREIHWYVETDDVRKGSLAFDTWATPYLDFTNPELHVGLARFADETARQAFRTPLDETHRQNHLNYLRWVIDINQRVGLDAEGYTSSGAALVLATTCGGELKWLASNDLSHFFMTRQELEVAMKIDLGPLLKRDVELKQDVEIRIDEGFGFGM